MLASKLTGRLYLHLQLFAALSQCNYTVVSDFCALISPQSQQLWTGSSKASEPLVSYGCAFGNTDLAQWQAQTHLCEQAVADLRYASQQDTLKGWQGSCQNGL